VNVALAPILLGAALASRSAGWAITMHDANHFLWMVLYIDVYLLAFNILPIYPLDGGQILRSLLWFLMGRARSLMAATVLGMVGLVGFLGIAVYSRSVWLGLISVYLLFICWGGLQQARQLHRQAKLPRRRGFRCPSCRSAPPIGPYWKCSACAQPFDTFETQGVCPHCSARFSNTMCLDCQEQRPISEWAVGSYAGAGVVNGEYPAR
jgi:DNA-directed RNA polymerase subunit RPC12/RpoP